MKHFVLALCGLSALPAAQICAPGAPSSIVPRIPGEATLPAMAREATRLPLTFVENAGQWDTPARFVAAMGATVIRVEEGGILVDARPGQGDERLLLSFDFVGARDGVEPVGEEALPGVRNYLLGNDPERWRTAVPGYARVVYPDLYAGVDLRLREAAGRLEYDLLLAPGADPSQVVVHCAGVSGIAVDEDGGLELETPLGTLRQTPPVSWTVLPSGEREPLECRFRRVDETSYGFHLAGREADLPVVIDPGLEWATFLGGSDRDEPFGMTRRANGELVVVGMTASPRLPRPERAVRDARRGH